MSDYISKEAIESLDYEFSHGLYKDTVPDICKFGSGAERRDCTKSLAVLTGFRQSLYQEENDRSEDVKPSGKPEFETCPLLSPVEVRTLFENGTCPKQHWEDEQPRLSICPKVTPEEQDHLLQLFRQNQPALNTFEAMEHYVKIIKGVDLSRVDSNECFELANCLAKTLNYDGLGLIVTCVGEY